MVILFKVVISCYQQCGYDTLFESVWKHVNLANVFCDLHYMLFIQVAFVKLYYMDNNLLSNTIDQFSQSLLLSGCSPGKLPNWAT